MIEARAPGKLVLVGEYAVLHGAAAIAVAVDVRAEVLLERQGGPGSELVTGPGNAAPFRWAGDGQVHWEGGHPGPNGRPLEAVLAALAAAGHLPRAGDLPACRIRISSTEFQREAGGHQVKLGLGSSAAVTVALLGALLRLAGGVPVERRGLLGLAMDAHRRLQGGRGSGIDVAAALFGGVVGRSDRVQPLPWPRGLHLAALWTGVAASTPELLHHFEHWQQRAPQAFAAQMERMRSIAALALAGWQAGDVQRLLAAVSAYDGALFQLDQAASIGIYTPAHLRLRELCREHGLACKPSGAGGGDFGIALGSSRAAMDRLRARCEAEGIYVLDRPLCAPGLAISARG
jgi:phosphomevalonate kinase